LENEPFLAFLREQSRRARYVTSMCSGALLLGAAGLLNGDRATTHWMSTRPARAPRRRAGSGRRAFSRGASPHRGTGGWEGRAQALSTERRRSMTSLHVYGCDSS